MNLISQQEIMRLMKYSQGNCISIYLTGHVGEWASGAQQNKIKLKNLVRDARSQLVARNVAEEQIEALMAPIVNLLDEDMFWQEQSPQLVIFSAPNMFQTYRLPLALPMAEGAVVSNHFSVNPLLEFLHDQTFFILALSKTQVKLYKVMHQTGTEVPLPAGVPHNLSEIVKYDQHENQEHFMSARPERGDARTGTAYDSVYHGGEEEESNDQERFYLQVNKGLQEILNSARVPLILAGLDYLLPIYRKVNSYEFLMDEAIKGNAEIMSLQELHDSAWQIAEQHFAQMQAHAIDVYNELSAKNLASNNLAEIVSAAFQSRIDTLYLMRGMKQWGSYDAGSDKVTISGSTPQQAKDEDLLELLARTTIERGGAVYLLDNEQMPDGAAAAAIFRFALTNAAAHNAG